jgi:phosphoribosylaminoimidazole-succinocarboxamide synthase
MLVKRTQPIPIECVARGYLTGSGWQEYTTTGKVCGIVLPLGLRESERLPEPIFTPATKAESGHDINISENEAAKLIGRKLVDKLRELTLSLYKYGAEWAEKRKIIVADTKFEFGQVGNKDSHEILLIDEVLTPDSSRFWPSSDYAPGRAQSSFDKQYVRDYLDSIKWNKKPPVPELPSEVIEETRKKYIEAFELLAEKKLT